MPVRQYALDIQQPDIGSALQAYRTGVGDRRAQDAENRQNALRQYLPGALKGDKQAIDQVASIDPEWAMKLDDRQLQQAKERQTTFAKAAFALNTPEAWAANMPQLMQELGLDGPVPEFSRRNIIMMKAQNIGDMIDAQFKERSLVLDESRTKAQNAASYASAAASRASAAKTAYGGNRDPNTGVRTPPAGVQGRDQAQLQKYEQEAEAFAGIANTLRSAEGAMGRVNTGPGTGLARMAAAPFAVLPGVFPSAAQFVADYDAIDQAAKVAGIEKLKGIGGSDTERELLTAIQTGVNTETPGPENKRRKEDALKAAEIVAQKSKLAAEWLNRFGSLTYAAPDGTTWQGFWPAYQKAAWRDHLRQRGMPPRATQGSAPASNRGPAPPPGFKVVP